MSPREIITVALAAAAGGTLALIATAALTSSRAHADPALSCRDEWKRMDAERKKMIEDGNGTKELYRVYRGPDRESWAADQIYWLKVRQAQFVDDMVAYKRRCTLLR